MFRHCPGIAQSLHRDRCSLNPQGLSDKGHFSRGASGSHKTFSKKPPTDVQVKSICRFLRGGWLTSGGGWVEGSQGCGGVFRPSACLCSCANSKTIPELQHNQELSARPGREGGPPGEKGPQLRNWALLLSPGASGLPAIHTLRWRPGLTQIFGSSQIFQPWGVLLSLLNPFLAQGKHCSLGVVGPGVGALGWVASIWSQEPQAQLEHWGLGSAHPRR